MSSYKPRGDQPPPLPKPYDFVHIPNAPTKLEPPIGHADYKGELVTGTITGTLIARSPIHVASGMTETTDKQPSLVKAHFRCNGRPTIPGASLKGAIRSIVEAISSPPSCLRITQARFDNLPSNVKRCSDKKRLCIACGMFGAMGYLGQIHFCDGVSYSDQTEIIQIPPLHPPRPRERLYYESGKVIGRKFYMHGQDGKTALGNVPTEVCPEGATFSLRIDFENLSDGQLALLLCAMGQGTTRLFPKLGGGKPACCGSIEIVDIAVKTISAKACATSFEVESTLENLASLTSAMRNIDTDNLNQLARILTYPGERACPDRNY